MTKVLLFCHPEGDFLEAAVYKGFQELLGADGIVDYPSKRSYHGEVHRYPSVYAHGDPIGTTAPFAWMPNFPGREWSEDEVVAAIRDRQFDVAVFTPRTYALRDLRALIARVGRDSLPPLVLMDGEDYSTMGTFFGGSEWSLIDEFRPNVYLKRELLPENHHNHGQCRVEPFPLCSPYDPREPAKKDIDIFFPCGATSGFRGDCCAALRERFGTRFVGGTDVRFGPTEYLDALNRAKIAVSVRGWGLDTFRYWEIPSFETLMVADAIPLVRNHPFTHGENILFFDSVQKLVDGVRCALEDEPWRERLAKVGNAHLRRYHTGKARAQQLLDHALRG